MLSGPHFDEIGIMHWGISIAPIYICFPLSTIVCSCFCFLCEQFDDFWMYSEPRCTIWLSGGNRWMLKWSLFSLYHFIHNIWLEFDWFEQELIGYYWANQSIKLIYGTWPGVLSRRVSMRENHKQTLQPALCSPNTPWCDSLSDTTEWKSGRAVLISILALILVSFSNPCWLRLSQLATNHPVIHCRNQTCHHISTTRKLITKRCQIITTQPGQSGSDPFICASRSQCRITFYRRRNVGMAEIEITRRYMAWRRWWGNLWAFYYDSMSGRLVSWRD